jgi:hypothetical protein
MGKDIGGEKKSKVICTKAMHRRPWRWRAFRIGGGTSGRTTAAQADEQSPGKGGELEKIERCRTPNCSHHGTARPFSPHPTKARLSASGPTNLVRLKSTPGVAAL